MFTKHVSQVSHVICGSKNNANVYQAIEFECMYGICSFSEGIHISVCAREMYQTHSKVEHFATVERPILNLELFEVDDIGNDGDDDL